MADVVAAATDELAASLQRDLQSEAPLELVRRATEPVTAVLRERGVAPVSRDARSQELHPDDLYDLYPATSRNLGEDVWRVHMQWGLERARLVAGMVPAPSPPDRTVDSAAQSLPHSKQPATGPAVAVFGVAEPLRSEMIERIRSLGYQTSTWRNPAALEEGLAAIPALALVDLRHPTAEGALRRLVAEGIRVIAIGEGVTDFTQAATMALGAEEVIELDRVVDLLDSRLPRFG